MKNWFVALALVCAGASAPVVDVLAADFQVTIDNFSFSPASVTVAAGTRVVFLNRDDLPHTVVLPDTKQHSPMLDTDDTFAMVMDTPGKYSYFCSVHPMMKGEIVVTSNP